MKGDALLLSRVIAGGRVQFIIPVYQRNYSWLTENCNQLFNDLPNKKPSPLKNWFSKSNRLLCWP